ncbi:MAG: transcription antitermination factor NusB [Acidimicrobiia bacterium]|nr:transcription antitermination factor NusB [Acidimicrobiia bacterium]
MRTPSPGGAGRPKDKPGAKNPAGSSKSGVSAPGGRRSAARLAAVQALYEIEFTGIPAEGVLKEFLARRWALTETHVGAGEEGAAPEPLVTPDLAFLGELIGGAQRRKKDLDQAIQGALAPDGTPFERLEPLLRAILRLGAFELAERPDIDAATVIDEYVELARAFFTWREPALVNGMLDRLARELRGGASHGAGKAADAG